MSLFAVIIGFCRFPKIKSTAFSLKFKKKEDGGKLLIKI